MTLAPHPLREYERLALFTMLAGYWRNNGDPARTHAPDPDDPVAVAAYLDLLDAVEWPAIPGAVLRLAKTGQEDCPTPLQIAVEALTPLDRPVELDRLRHSFEDFAKDTSRFFHGDQAEHAADELLDALLDALAETNALLDALAADLDPEDPR